MRRILLLLLTTIMSAYIYSQDYEDIALPIKPAMLSMAITLPNYQVILLNDGQQANISDVHFDIVPYKGIFAIAGNELLALDKERCEDTNGFQFPDTFNIDEVVFLPSIPVFKSGKSILYLNERKKIHGMNLDTDNFHIKQANDTSIYIITNNMVFTVNPRKGLPKLCINLKSEEKIIDFMPLQKNDTLITTDYRLLLLNKNNLSILATLPTQINAVNISPHGIFIGTDSGLYQYNDANKLSIIAEEPISQILNDADCLYVVTSTGDIYRLQWQPQTNTKKKTKSKNR